MGLKLIRYYKVLMKMFPETKNPATAGLDVDEWNVSNYFVNVNCIQTSSSTFHVIEFPDRLTVMDSPPSVSV